MKEIKRPSPDVIEALRELGTDAVTSTMDLLGVRRTFIEGPVARVPGSKIVGPALTLRFVPQREDQMRGYKIPGGSPEESKTEGEEAGEVRSALWEVFDHVKSGDVIVVDGRGDLATGCFGEMLMIYFKAQGGEGVVIDAAIRDSAQIFNDQKVPVWSVGVTTGGAGHMNLFPADVNLPIGCGKVLVNPGDIIMADDGGAIVVPPVLIPKVLEIAGEREEHEVFARLKLQQGGALRSYYPFDEQGKREYQEWLVEQKKKENLE
ncbi:MAG: ribonuclease activity regulator RraA [Solibacterales bacterium]|uniref:Putative 4-hydroxy-4-methyl-2-oxoglutarate aldolase n=1 Tax=Candidatus Moanibacter tarae TaxID=2200854 RepID=A0A2Z4ADK5_9BACT|nr:MAG: 4-hydroxy-4-methyl-2-oxoglutarate aldolase/4-carboxy-4-hydroxy-2-oxoadipate aldolase [Candidatus Moanabacter tarae]MBG99897.1 ribonuclease activity regulator RraA [Bryobacterales bacterium]|tara:strand:- start:13930 stop:14718 length:789 start_codon:yes stop_codon:yes gene_type:complete